MNASTIVVTLYKASAIRGDEPMPSLEVHATEPAPDLVEDLVGKGEVGFNTFNARCRTFYSAQAKSLAEALLKTLPGGTIDALLVELLDHKRSIYRVLHDPPRTLPTIATEPGSSPAPIEPMTDRAKRIVVGAKVDVHRYEDAQGPVDFHGTVSVVDGNTVFVENAHGGCKTTLSRCALVDETRNTP